MDDKTFEMIEKLYNRMEERFDEQDSKMDSVKTALKQDMVVLEQTLGGKIDILFDAVQRNEESIKALGTKVEKHEFKMKLVD